VGVSGDIVGRPAGAVLIPPQAARFASLTGADPDRLVLNVTGWNKLVLLDADRVFLFPRAAAGVEWFERELAVYQALAQTGLEIVPRLLGGRAYAGSAAWTPTHARWRPPSACGTRWRCGPAPPTPPSPARSRSTSRSCSRHAGARSARWPQRDGPSAMTPAR
jgi:hypothetical protein